MTKFYTKTGDDGYTRLLGEGRTAKYDPRIETIGALDEANAAIGIARSICKSDQTTTILLTAQRDLYHIMTEVAVLPENSSHFQGFTAERIAWLEGQIDELGKKVTIPNEFIVPGDSPAGAALDLARTIVRRAERQIARLLHQQLISNRDLLRYINRLSSLCFALELLENHAEGNNQVTLAKG